MADASERPARSFPVGTIVLALLAALFYVALLGTLGETRTSDAMGRGLAAGFAAIFGAALWIVLAVLLMIAYAKGRMPGWASIVALVLLPLSAIAAFVAIELYTRLGGWPFFVPALLPPLFLLYALWARIPAFNVMLPANATSLFFSGASAILSLVPLADGYFEFTKVPTQMEKVDASYKYFLEKQDESLQQQRTRDDKKFAALNENSSLRDYVPFLNGADARARQAAEGARKVKSRHNDAIAMLGEGKLNLLTDMWRLDITLSAALCDAYRDALRTEEAKIDRSRKDYLKVALDLESQLPNMKWFVGPRCDLSAVLGDLATRVRAVRDSERMDRIAESFEALSRQN